MFQRFNKKYFLAKKTAMNNIQVFNSIEKFKRFRGKINGTVGFVPTMGALHAGHASLLKLCSTENDFSVLSIYINPTQFNNPTDLEKYPKTFEADLKLAAECGIHAVLLPDYSEIYADQYRYKLSESDFSKILCGAHRPGHFDGVLTIVLKLLNIVKSDRAYFGKKDYQQFKLIENMVDSFFVDTKIIGAETVREESGLAMSSRNMRLSEAALKKAALIYQFLKSEKTALDVKNKLILNGFDVDYVEDISNRRYVAALIEGVRLIDNVEI